MKHLSPRRLFLGMLALSFVALWFLHAGDQPRTGPVTEKRFPPLKVPTGFKATLFACDPLIEYPSVISIGPKPGALFVAIDYMTGLGTDGKVKSEIRLIEDTDGDGYADKATVVAKGFNSIQGLAYHNDTLYVMHAPFLTALRYTKKTGVADERKDLLSGLGLKPEDNSSRLHCANGVVVGHDGWLYLALGDNGVNVPRPEGDRLIHNGGGILRCRPDGRDLHVFSTGLRNIYDIALDAELNVFTRDNENDGGTYMIRVCHCFHGSDHGYPYHYEERKAEAMPPIGDFGLGSSAGGVCYLEKQFPPEYRGNLFFCEWGKSVVRYPLRRGRSGFEPVKEIDFAIGDPKDTYPFKPTDIVVQRDGTLMVADYADGQRPKRGRGRIYNVRYVGQDSDPVKELKPASEKRTLIEWLKQLDSESHYERWEAQEHLERQKADPSDVLIDAIDHGLIGSRAPLHAIWILAHRNGPKALDDLVNIAKFNPDTRVRAQAIRAIADLTDPVLVQHKSDAGRGEVKRAELLAAIARGQEAAVTLEAVIALGRLRWAGLPDWLKDNIKKPDAALMHAAQQAMRRSENWPAIVKLLDEPDDSPARTIALRAIAEQYQTHVVDGLITRLGNEKKAERRQEYADALMRVYKKPGPWKYWGYRPGPRPANTDAWERTEVIAKALDRALLDPDRVFRLNLLKRMQREKVPVRLETLGDWLQDEYQPERAAIILASLAGRTTPATVRPYFDKVIRDKKHRSANRLTALGLYLKEFTQIEPAPLLDLAQVLEDGPVLAEVLRCLGPEPRFSVIALLTRKLDSPDAEVRAAAIERLGRLGAKEAHESVIALLKDKDVRVRRAAAGAAGKLEVKEAIEPLLKLLADVDMGVRIASLDSLGWLREKRALPMAVAALREREIDLKALEYLHVMGGPDQTRAVVEFAKQYPSSDIPPRVVGALLEWHNSGVTEPQKQALERAIAKVHGDSGVLTYWRIPGQGPKLPGDKRPGPKPEDIIKPFVATGKIPENWGWTLAEGAESRLRLQTAEFAKKETWFAATELAVSDTTNVEFLASSRGSLQVWLNGKLLHSRDKPRTFQLDSDRFSATLAMGANRLLVETGSGNGDVEFHLRFRKKSAKAAHEKLTQAALTKSGNAERGRKIFFDKDKSQCIKCHQLGNQGERFGPELTGVGGRFSRIYLIESILEPSRTIAPSFGTLAITLKNGKLLNGVKVAENEKTLTLADNQGQKHVLAKADIEEQNVSAVSTMPEGLELRMTEDDFVDLIAFLSSQKAK